MASISLAVIFTQRWQNPEMCHPSNPSKNASIEDGSAEIKAQYNYTRRSAFAQILATLIQNWLLIEIGLDWAMPTMVIGALHRNSDESFNMDDDEASWFGSISSICHPLASLSSGYFQELLGRKSSMILVTIPTCAAWITLYFAQSAQTLYLVAGTMGICTGLTEAPLHSYIGEIGEPHLRGSLSTLSQSAGFIGVFLMYLLCYFYDWRTVALICSACPIITFTSMTQIPESPTWLIVKGRLEEAKKSLCWLRGWVKPCEVEEEFQTLLDHTKKSVRSTDTTQMVEDHASAKIDGYLRMQFERLTSKKVLLPLGMVCIVFFFSVVAGFVGIRPYLIGELKKLGVPIDPKLILIAFQILVFVGAMMNVLLLRRFGKRRIALFSYSTHAFSILVLGIYCSSMESLEQFPKLAWLPVIFMLTLGFLTGFSSTLLPWQLVSELFPIVGRGLASGISAAWAYIVGFILVKSFLYTETWIGLSGVTYAYGAVSVIGVAYIYFYLPETEGKTLEQIEKYFTKNHDRKEKFSIGKSTNNAGLEHSS